MKQGTRFCVTKTIIVRTNVYVHYGASFNLLNYIFGGMLSISDSCTIKILHLF